MTAFEVEEEIDVLSCVINTLNTNISYLETVSFKDGRYNLYIAQIIEICTNLESRLADLEGQLDNFSKEELQESVIEHLKRNIQYNEAQEI